MKNICVLGGGGAKGMLQITIINELYKMGMWPDFDIYFCSSVGALNGAALASGNIDPSSLFSIWPDLAKKAFKRERILSPIYNRQNVIDVWRQIVKKKKMKDVDIKLVISSIDFVEMKQHFFKSWEDKEMLLEDAIVRSFAAPYYFGKIIDNKFKKVWGDGGMANDNLPITEALLETINHGWDWNTENIKFTVIGTGFQDISQPFEIVSKHGLLGQLLSFMKPGDGGLARVLSRQNQLGQLLFIAKYFPKIKFDYYDSVIPERMDGMDKINCIGDYIHFGINAAKKPLISI